MQDLENVSEDRVRQEAVRDAALEVQLRQSLPRAGLDLHGEAGSREEGRDEARELDNDEVKQAVLESVLRWMLDDRGEDGDHGLPEGLPMLLGAPYHRVVGQLAHNQDAQDEGDSDMSVVRTRPGIRQLQYTEKDRNRPLDDVADHGGAQLPAQGAFEERIQQPRLRQITELRLAVSEGL